MQMMRIQVNDKPREVCEGITLGELLEQLGAHPRLTAVVHNGNIIRREQYQEVRLRVDDRLEIVTMVGGG